MVKSLEIDCGTEIDQSALYEFSRRMTDFCRRGRKPRKQIIAICELLIPEDNVRKSIPWREIDAALKFSTCQDLNQLHSKLLHRLRESCLRACFEIDPELCKPFNQHGFIFAARQGYGVQLGCIRRYNGRGFNYSALQTRAAPRFIPIETVEPKSRADGLKRREIVERPSEAPALLQEQLDDDRMSGVPLTSQSGKRGLQVKSGVLRGHSFRQRLLSHSSFEEVTFIGCDFSNAVLSDASFIGTKFVNCNFEGAVLTMSRFHGVKLVDTHFCHSNLERSVWNDVDLAGVRFSGSNFWGALLSEAYNLHLADFRFCNFCRTEMTDEQSAHIKSLSGIASAFRYVDVLRAFEEFFPKFPESLWWLKILTDADAGQMR